MNRLSLTLVAGLAFTAAAQAQLVLDQSNTSNPGSLGGRGAGQTFFPEDVAGYAGQATLELVELSLWSGNLGGAGSPTTYIAVYDGDPDTSTFIGSSTNSIDTSSAAAVPNYTEWTWTFDSLPLDASTEYWCVLSSAPIDDNATTIVERSIQTWSADVYRGRSIIANRSPHQSGYDARFRASFDVPVVTLPLDHSATSNPGSLGGRGAGQTLFPEDAAGYAGQATLDLVELSLWSGNLGGVGSPTTYIAVYDGDPDTSMFLGSSTNSIDTSAGAAVPNYTQWTWSFDSLTLDAATEYWCVLSSAPIDDNATTIVERSLQTWSADVYRGTSIIANRAPHGSSNDLRFLALFSETPSLGTNYCSAAVNSTGASAVISVMGQSAVAANDLMVLGDQMPANAFAFCIASTTQGFVPNSGGSAGNLCLAGDIGRGVGGMIVNTGAAGSVMVTADLTAMPHPSLGSVAVMPGETWNFQWWFRDAVGGMATSNFTDGVSVTFN